jgi:general secretion pathway protein H
MGNLVVQVLIVTLVIGMQVNSNHSNLRRLLYSPSKTQGFTLIEILVVLLIIGITISFALLAFGDFGEKRRIITKAEEFSQYIKVIQQQAILEATPYAIQIHPKNFTVLRFKKSNWQLVPAKAIFRHATFPDGMVAHLTPNTMIVINPSGNITPFQLDFGTKKQPIIVRMISKSDDISLLNGITS